MVVFLGSRELSLLLALSATYSVDSFTSIFHYAASPRTTTRRRRRLQAIGVDYLSSLTQEPTPTPMLSYLDTLSSTGASQTTTESTKIVSYLDAVSSMVMVEVEEEEQEEEPTPAVTVIADKLLVEQQQQQQPQPVVVVEEQPVVVAAAAEVVVPAADDDVVFSKLFDFSTGGGVASFERIDDAIMGGISTSSLKDVEGEDYASWSGVCRLDGGGFCGMRTLPFTEPLQVSPDTDGFFVDCRFVSDDEPERRVWKMTVRTDKTRGEIVYQAMFEVPSKTDGFTRVRIPFDSLRLVRGARLMPDAPPFDPAGGLFQMGMTMSKFGMGVNMTTVDDFRPGYFELQVASMGTYGSGRTTGVAATTTTEAVATVTPAEARRQRPLLLRLLLPVTRLFFSEKANRRKSALKILTERRGSGRLGAIRFGLRSRAASSGWVQAVLHTSGILAVDALRLVLGTVLKYCLFYPLVGLSRGFKFVKSNVFKMEAKRLPPLK